MLFVIFFAALALCVLLTKRHVVSWNDGSRIATVDALTSQRTFRIDGSPFAVGLGDEIRFRGATYSDKPPLLSILAAGVAFALAPLGITLRHTPGTAIYLVTLFTVGVAFAGGCAYAYALQRSLGFGRRLALAVSALTGTATLALPYATVLTNHVPAGAAGLAAVNHMLRARNGRLRNTLFAGFFYGLTFAFDAAAAILAISGAVLLIGAPLRRWVLCTCAAIPLVAFQLAYNRAISGSVVPTVFNAHAWSDPSLPLHWWSSHIFEVFSPLQYARFTVDLLVGVRGLLSFTPLVAVAVYGFVRLWRSDADGRRLASAVAATFVV
ncbi:MAG: hypothetical protein JOZ24_00945, partial [Candidatus Eremiobacteraeota bacterium]|nr:hypothetical protein [Candidatus Eremiobacteraeota bacterium]